ncbi:PREDICTED: tumor necrosis factor receptor superfamily member 19L-like [Calidris pugnax]|uniref:tumor necrosis factor receptor superfamily member 19L-like n=1 Tax=Calidris pugnax TaxID=198806 RepID=UPI00071E3618|nr:PREDICTED: tumor necrosis factor receptor superfamily member 19L-like [Calidris pugnax]
MKRSGMCWWLVTILGVLSGPSAGGRSCGPQDHGPPGCPPGEEPSGACGSARGPVGTCRACPPGTFSPGDVSCSPHTHCGARNRILVAPGTPVTDSHCGACLPGFYSPEGERDPRGRCLPCAAAPRSTLGCPAGTPVTDSHCGACLPGFYSPEGERDPRGRCLPCAAAPRSTPGCPGWRRARSPETPGQMVGTNGTRGMLKGEEEEEEEEAAAAQAAVLTIVPVFCAMGLLGILVCNLLKKKGYHCTANKDPQPGGTGPSSIYQLEDPNEDTIGVLVRLITEKKENAAALEELLKEHHGQQAMPPPGYTPQNKLYLSCRGHLLVIPPPSHVHLVSLSPSSIYQLEDPNEDTIGVLVRLITEKKENAAALEELLKEHHGQQAMPPPGYTPQNKLYLLPQFPPACRHQQHLHTVQGPAPCARCSQKKWPQVLPSLGATTKVPKPGGRPGEVTILSVGR